jgi:hypothetical protein
MSPTVVAKLLSADGVLVSSTIGAVAILRTIVLAAGLVAAATGMIARQRPSLWSDISLWVCSRSGLALLSVAAFAYLFSGLSYQLNVHDEGAWLYNAERVLAGDVPYRDYWSNYAPGQDYLLALLFKVFGPSIIVARVFSRLLAVVIVVLTYALARRLAPAGLALLAAALTTLWIKTFDWSSGSPILTAVFLTLVSCLFIATFLSTGRTRWLALSGLCAGMSTLFRHDVGFFTFIAETVVLTSVVTSNSVDEHAAREGTLHPTSKQLAVYVGSTALVVVSVAALLIATVPAHDLLTDLVWFPLFRYPQVRSLPILWPIPNPGRLMTGQLGSIQFLLITLERFQYYFPLIVLAAAAVWVARAFKSGRPSHRHWLGLLMLLLGVTFVNQIRVRFNVTHLFPLVIPAFILWAALLATEARRGWYSLVMWSCGALTVISIFVPRVEMWVASRAMPTATLQLARARGVEMPAPEAEALSQAVSYVEQHVPPGERIFVGNAGHDQIFIANVMFYVLAARHSATKYHILEPGVATTQPVQQAIVRDLKSRARYVVLWTAAQLREPNESGASSGVRDLDEFIGANYQLVQRFGNYDVLKRRWDD